MCVPLQIDNWRNEKFQLEMAAWGGGGGGGARVNEKH